MTHSTTRTIPSSQDGEKLLVILEELRALSSLSSPLHYCWLIWGTQRFSLCISTYLSSIYLPIIYLPIYLLSIIHLIEYITQQSVHSGIPLEGLEKHMSCQG